jgi:hypothetical protein
MARRVVWSPRALDDVDAIAAYIAADSPFYAGSVVRRILTLTRTLEKFPFAGRKVPEFDDENLRELICLQLPDHVPGRGRGGDHRSRNPRQAEHRVNRGGRA